MSESPTPTSISLTTGTIVKFFAIAILFVAIYYLSDIAVVVMAAIVIASGIEPVLRRMQRRGIHRIIGVVLIYLLIVLVLAAIAIFFMPLVIGDAVGFLNTIPKTISIQALWSPLSLAHEGLTASTTALTGPSISVSSLVSGLQSLIVGAGSGAIETVGAVFGGMLAFIIIMVLSFYLAVQVDGVDDFLRVVAPVKHHEYIIDLWKRSQRKIALWLQGQIILGIGVGVLVYIVLSIVGIPYALMLAVLAGLFEIIPVFGPVISAVPALAIAFTEKGAGTGFLLMGLYLIIHQFENQIFYPLVVKKIVGISPIVVILALVIGAKLAGVLGALIAVPISAAFMEYVHDIEKYKNAEIAERAVLGRKE